jgi:hypothetical protein
MATYDLTLPYRELRANLAPVHAVAPPVRRPRAARRRRGAPSIAHLRPASASATPPCLAVSVVAGAVFVGLAGTAVMGVALAYGLVAMTWSKAFATGLVGGAALGCMLGTIVGLVELARAQRADAR